MKEKSREKNVEVEKERKSEKKEEEGERGSEGKGRGKSFSICSLSCEPTDRCCVNENKLVSKNLYSA